MPFLQYHSFIVQKIKKSQKALKETPYVQIIPGTGSYFCWIKPNRTCYFDFFRALKC